MANTKKKRYVLVSKTVLVERELWTRVRVAAAIESETISGLVEKALCQYLERQAEKYGP